MGVKSIVAAVAAGAAAGVLLAPEKGTAIRQKIGDKLKDVKERWYKVKSSTSELEELKEVFSHEIEGLKDDTRKRVLEILEAAKTTGTRLKEQISA
jgi:gas vesicle protein